MFELFGEIKLFAFDLDGTLYVGEDPVEGAVRLVEYLREKYQIVFFTNNSSQTRNEVHDKLTRFGIKCSPDEIYVTSTATALYLKESCLDNLYVVGSKGFRREIEREGLRIVDNDSAENLVVGLDFKFDYNKIEIALSILLNNGKFIACNKDSSFPVGLNRFRPGCGAMIGAIVGASGRNPDYIVGKPNTYILTKIAEAYHVENHEIMVVGDSYESDIKMALNNKSSSILIGQKDNVSDMSVLVMEDLLAVLNYLKEN